jgi:hypothetical protein
VMRKRCRHEGCTNQAKNGGVCITHGANVKLCSFEGCPNHAQKGGVVSPKVQQRPTTFIILSNGASAE